MVSYFKKLKDFFFFLIIQFSFIFLKTQKFSHVSKKIYSWTIEVKKLCQRHKWLILLSKNVLKISNFEKSAKTRKNLKKP